MDSSRLDIKIIKYTGDVKRWREKHRKRKKE